MQKVIAAFEALSIPLVLCDARRRPVVMSASAERIVRKESLVRLREGRLQATCRACDGDLQSAISRAIAGAPKVDAAVLLRAPDWSELARAEVAAIPEAERDPPEACVCIAFIPRTRAAAERILEHLGLTPAEIEVTACLASGATFSEIAQSRGVGPETIRSQAKSIYAKLGVRRQAELAARFLGVL